MKIVIATIKSWNIIKSEEFKNKYGRNHHIKIVISKDELKYEAINELNPDFIFFPHWSYIIPPEIYENYNCVVFHMTDLPYGRGGSPLQNLIVRGHKDTMISAIRVTEGIDEGPIYMKEPLSLSGNAQEIFERAAGIIFDKMIPRFLSEEMIAKAQNGKVTKFARRSPCDSEILSDFDLGKIYDYIRMLDGEGYPRAFINFGEYRLEFDNAKIDDNKVIARVEFIKRKNE